jgi:hypothetical protein
MEIYVGPLANAKNKRFFNSEIKSKISAGSHEQLDATDLLSRESHSAPLCRGAASCPATNRETASAGAASPDSGVRGLNMRRNTRAIW